MTKPFVVIGGGPGGACAAALLAGQGAPVVVIEKDQFPRHHVGESLQPATFTMLDRHLGLGPTLAAQGFARKYGAVYVWGENRDPWTVLFDQRLEQDLPSLDEAGLLGGGYEHAWQVERARFDEILLTEAARRGADVRFGGEVESVTFDGERAAGVRLRSGEHIEAEAVIDASGQRGVIGKQLDLRRVVDDMRCVATYAYYDNMAGVPGPLSRHVQWVVSIDDGWCWFIPVSPTRTSVGVVSRQKGLMALGDFEEALRAAGFPLDGATRLAGAGQDGLRFARDWSFTSSRFAGPGWWLVGDAACFVDPILSGGVDFAIRSGFRAGLAALRVSVGDEAETTAAEAYDEQFRREYKAYLRLARYWYGNNRTVGGLFWEAHREIPPHAALTPLRAFVYLTTGRYAAERHLRVFQEWQEKKMFRQLGVDAEALRRARATEI